MKKKLAGMLGLALIMAGSPGWTQMPLVGGADLASAHRGHEESATTADLNGALERLAASLARALEDADIRFLIEERLRSPGDVPLRSLLGNDLAGSSHLATKLVEIYRRSPGDDGDALDLETAVDRLVSDLETVPHVDLSMPVNFDTWNPRLQVPVVSYVEEGTRDEDRTSVKLFDSRGHVTVRGVNEIAGFDFPVLVLEHHDRGASGEPSTPIAEEPGHPLAPGLAAKADPICTTTTFYNSYPLFSGAAVYDIHESGLNGPEGYAYFAAAGTEKTGRPPSSLGGRSGWATNVYASNFQGPKSVKLEPFAPVQWEWEADGSWETSSRTYPASYCRQKVTSPGSFSVASYRVKEDDDWPNPDDDVGFVEIDHRYCKNEVFDTGRSSGWSNVHLSPRVGDIKDVRYELYCYKTKTFTCSIRCSGLAQRVSCTGSGGCSGCETGPDWVECNGARYDCEALVH